METDAPPRAIQKAEIKSGTAVAAMVPSDIDQAYRLAQAFARSNMTPKSYDNNPDKIFVGILAGAEIGLTPMQSLQSIAVIGNNPSVWGDGALALVQASGLLVDMEETDDGQKATCRLVRIDRTTEIVRSFSMDDAKKAGLAGKSGPWTNYPQRMRQMRARAWALRDGFSDVLKGLRIAEEVRDYAEIDGGEIAAKSVPLTTAMLTQQAEDAGEPVYTDTPDNPAAAERPADDDRGDGFDGSEGDDTPAWQGALDAHLKRLKAVEFKADVNMAISDFSNSKAALPDDVRADVEAAEADALARFNSNEGN